MPTPTGYIFHSAVTPPAQPRDTAYWFVFQGSNLLVRQNGAGAEVLWAAGPKELGLPLVRSQYLGHLALDGQPPIPCYSAEADPATPLPDGVSAEGLRQLYTRLPDPLFPIAGRAVQIVDWDRTHQFCGRCGEPMESLPTERAKKCPACGLTNFPRLSPAIIIAIVRHTPEGPRLLLARNHRFPQGFYSVLAGFVEPGESLEECAHREVMEEVGIAINEVRYVASQPWPFPNSLMLGFTAEYVDGDFMLEEAEIAEAGWFAPDALPKLPPPPSIARRLIDGFVAEYG
jgi:NAD+ diphosphatase